MGKAQGAAPNSVSISPGDRVDQFRTMVRVRMFEERVGDLFTANRFQAHSIHASDKRLSALARPARCGLPVAGGAQLRHGPIGCRDSTRGRWDEWIAASRRVQAIARSPVPSTVGLLLPNTTCEG